MKYFLAAILITTTLHTSNAADESFDTFHGTRPFSEESLSDGDDYLSNLFASAGTSVKDHATNLFSRLKKVFEGAADATIEFPDQTSVPHDPSFGVKEKTEINVHHIKTNPDGTTSRTTHTEKKVEYREPEGDSLKSENLASPYNFSPASVAVTGGGAIAGAIAFHTLSDYLLKKYNISPYSPLYKTIKVMGPITGAVLVAILAQKLYITAQ